MICQVVMEHRFPAVVLKITLTPYDYIDLLGITAFLLVFNTPNRVTGRLDTIEIRITYYQLIYQIF